MTLTAEVVDDCEWLEPGDDLLVELVDDERGDGRTKGGEGVLAEIVVGALEGFAAKAVVSGPTNGYGSTERSPVKAGAARFAEMTDGDESVRYVERPVALVQRRAKSQQ